MNEHSFANKTLTYYNIHMLVFHGMLASLLIVFMFTLWFVFSLWPAVVRERIRDTYLYFGGSLIFTAASAVAVVRSPRIMAYMSRGSFMVYQMWLLIGTFSTH